jgi:ABC-type transport system involved in multi-copper enzyme maturation permease subunit
MTTATLNAELPRHRLAARWSPRLVRAELLKVRKRRGLVATAVTLTIVPMIVAYVVLGLLHAVDPAKHGPAGGAQNFADSLNFLGALTIVAGILVGATAGTGDLGAGVFRELVVTGRSRLALFAARIPAGLAFLLVPVAIGFTVSATSATLLAGRLDPPGAGLIVHSAAWLAVLAALSFVIALGFSSVISSRGTSIGVLLGWLLVAMPLLMQIGSLGVLREGLIGAATDRVEPAAVLGNGGAHVPMSLGATIIVIAVWAIVPLAAGAWRTSTRDA